MIYGPPIEYEEPVFRPPSEGKSLLIQQTIGCSNNMCTYCNMYRSKSYRERSSEEVLEDIRKAADYYNQYNVTPSKIFLCDGDALGASTDNLLKSLSLIRSVMPNVGSVGIYATAQNMIEKSKQELIELKEAGLAIAYLGMESGCDKVLHMCVKGNTSADMINGSQKLLESGMKLSIICMLGLGGRKFSDSHVHETAKALSMISPNYLSFLTTMAIEGTPYHRMVKNGFQMLTTKELLGELHDILSGCVFNRDVIFRTNHVSNMYPIGGTLNRDKDLILKTLRSWIEQTPENTYPPRPAHM